MTRSFVPAPAVPYLVEREEPLRKLRERLAMAALGTGNVALVTGEAGIGKTGILRALAESREDVRLWWGGCDALQTPQPLAPLYDIARLPNARFGAQLRSDGDRAQLFHGVIGELQEGRTATLLVVEDAHWADAATLDLLKFLSRRIAAVPCLLAISYRNDALAVDDPLRSLIGELRDAAHVELLRLSASGVETLARRALQSPAGIFEASNGNPLFVTELLRNPAEGMPDTIEDLVLGRFARLSESARAIVELVSIVPRQTERRLLDSVLGADVSSIEQCLNSGLLEADVEFVRFRHELARRVMERSLSTPTAQALHRKVLKALLADEAECVSAARIAHHATHAGDAEAIVRYVPAAAREAARRKAHREAIAHYDAVFACPAYEHHPERAFLLEAYAQECQFTAQLADAIAAREAAAELHHNAGNAIAEGESLSELALAYMRALRFPEAVAASLQSVELLETGTPTVKLAHAYRVQAHLRMLDHERDEALAWSKRAIDLAERCGSAEVLSAALGVYGAATAFTDYDAGCRHMQRAADIAADEGFDFMAAVIRNNLGWVSADAFRLEQARLYFSQSIAYATQRDIDSAATYAIAWLAMCDMYLGRWDEAEEHARQVIEGTDRTVSRVIALVALAFVTIRRGDADAEPLLEDARSLVDPADALRMARIRAASAEAAFLQGDRRRVIAEALPVLEFAASCGHEWLGGELSYLMMRCGAADVPKAPVATPFRLQIEGKFRDAAAAWASLGCPYERARALAEGDVASQLEALEIFDHLGARPAGRDLRRLLRVEAVRGVPRGQRSSTKSHPAELTDRELEIVVLLCEGLKNAEIAGRLCLSVRTVDHHIAAAFAKLRVSTRTEAVAAAMRLGIASPARFPGDR